MVGRGSSSTRGPAAARGRVLVLVLALGLTGPIPRAGATPAAHQKIPTNDFGCTLCHNGSGVGIDTVPVAVAGQLSAFGTQWRELAGAEVDRLWGIMSGQNADRDGCSNGCELGDPLGVYEPGDSVPVQTCAEGDPNLADCTVPLDEDSWSTLKSLFSDN